MAAASAHIEAGQMFLLNWARWLAEFRSEVMLFPARRDDEIDSMSQLLGWATRPQSFAPLFDWTCWATRASMCAA